MERLTATLIILLNANSLVLAQASLPGDSQNKIAFYEGIDMSVAVAGGSVKYAVLMNEKHGLGYYYGLGDAKTVKFRICGSDTTQDVSMDQLRKTTESCRSIPGKPIKPLTNSAQWSYDGEKGSYLVVLDGMEAGRVPCAKAPISVIKAAQYGMANKSGLIATADSRLANTIATEWNIDGINYIGNNSAPKPSDCAAAPEFWTIPVSGSGTQSNFLAVSAKQLLKTYP